MRNPLRNRDYGGHTAAMRMATTPALAMAKRIELWPVERLVPYERNARTHSSEQVAQLAASIAEFGFLNPILVDSADGIIAGHGRLAAAKDMGLAEVPVVVLDHLTEAQKRAYVLADNKLALNAGWDESLLRLELTDLGELDFDLSLIGFSEDELAELMPEVEELPPEDADEESVPEAPAEPVTKPGDVWLLGKHRLMCGDCTDVLAVEKLMVGEIAAVCLTDPPYGLGGNKASGKNSYDVFDDSRENLVELIAGWLPLAQQIAPVVVFSPGINNVSLYPEAQWIMCWFYGGGQLKSAWGFNCWQPFLCYGKDPSFASCSGARPDAVNMNTPANAADINHPCPKPVALWEWFIERLSFKKSDLFYEPFGGSGTTIIACEKQNRRCNAIELSPRYCDVIVKRWQQFTGKRATLESTGEQFPEDE